MANKKGNKIVNNKSGKKKNSKDDTPNRHKIAPDFLGSKKLVTIGDKEKQKVKNGLDTCVFTSVSSPIIMSEDNNFSQCVENELIGRMSPANRFAFDWMNKNADRLEIDEDKTTEEEIKFKNKSINKELTELLQNKFGLDSTEIRQVIKTAIAIRDSRQELVEGLYIPNSEERIEKRYKRIAEVELQLASLNEKRSKTKGNKIQQRIDKKTKLVKQLNLLIEKDTRKLNKWNAELKSGKYSVCFGTAELFRNANRYLELSKNVSYSDAERQNFKSKSDELFQQWRFDRNSEYKIGGSKTFKSGNQKFTLTPVDGGFLVSIALPKSRCEKYATKNNVVSSEQVFTFGKDLNSVIELAIRKYRHYNRKESRPATKYPVTFLLKKGFVNRLITNDAGNKVLVSLPCYRLHVTYHVEFLLQSDNKKGAIGIDINSGSIDLAYINGQGQYIGKKTIRFNLQGKRAYQNKDQISKVLEQIVKEAAYLGIPIVKENLKFNRSGNVDKSRKFRRMAGSLNASQIDTLLVSKCWKYGIDLIKVKPSYTSFIGMWKYMKMYGINSGVAAGIVIARRGLGFVEKLPKAVINKSGQLPIDGCLSADKFWGYLSSQFNQKGGKRHFFFNPTEEMLNANCWTQFKNWNTAIQKRSVKG